MTGPGGYVVRRWRGEIALRTLFWRDMLGFGTAINLLASFVALTAASQGVDIRVAAALHFAPLPYDLFVSLFRSWSFGVGQSAVFKGAIAAMRLNVMTIV